MVCRNVTKGSVVASQVAIAATAESRRRGFLGRTAITSDEGILLVPCASVHTIGMKFAIDIVFLDARRRVVEIRPSVPPGIPFIASLRASETLELAAGTAALRHLQVRDRLVFAPAADDKEKEKGKDEKAAK